MLISKITPKIRNIAKENWMSKRILECPTLSENDKIYAIKLLQKHLTHNGCFKNMSAVYNDIFSDDRMTRIHNSYYYTTDDY